MIQEIKYPQKYVPIARLEVCSNELIGGGNIVGFDNFSPLLIGKGDIPLVWIYARADKLNWIPVVTQSESKHSKILIEKRLDQRELIISVEKVVLIHAKMLNDESCIVNQLDLRPVGLDLHGDSNELVIGNSKFSGNTFQGVTFMIGISEDQTDYTKG
jgi:hypothetical protein